MSFAAAVQWWEDWQLRLLVLASLFFQYFLFAAALVRKRRIPHWFRALIWLAYQGGDVVAIYALATLFNQHKEEVLARYPASAHLDTLWAPALLLHLGGQDGITAYSIEDNENWRRYLLLAVCQITVAIYVFRTSWWSGDLVLLRAAILLFVPGILKCLEKPWALKNATATSLINSSDTRMKATFDDDDGLRKDIYSQEQYVQAAVCTYSKFESKALEIFDDEVADHPFHLFVDLGHPYSIRLQNLQLVAPGTAATADVHGLVRSSLSKAFDRLYTKHKASFGGLLRAAIVLLTFVDIGLFQRSHRGVYHRADVVVTYVLLCCTAALEFVSACLVLGSGLPKPDDQLAQYNLVAYLARAEKHPRLWALARMLGARLQLDRLWCTAPPEPSLGITRLVYNHVADGWKDDIWQALYDAATGGWKRKPTPAADGVIAYRRFNDSRGQRTLKKKKCEGRSAIEESLRMPFDESVLIWHLATEFCYFDHVDTGHDATRHSRMMSNYMAFLLFVEPEMLIPGARSKLFTATCHELKKMLKPPEEDDEAIEVEPTEKKAPPPRAKNEMVRKVIQKVKSGIGHLDSEDLVHKAWAVAHELMEFAKYKEPEFRKEEKERRNNRTKVMNALRCAKKKADEFIERDKVLNNLMEVMRPAKEKADEFINVKSNREEFMKVIKDAKEKIELLIKQAKTTKQTKEEERITKLLQRAKNMAEQLIKDEEERKELTVEEFSKNAGEVIKEAEEEKEKLKVAAKKEANDKAAEFMNKATEFISVSEEKKKDQTKEEEEMRKLLESAKNKAEEFVKNQRKTAAEEFSKRAGEAIRQAEEEDRKVADAKEWHLIVDDDELLMIRSRERADDEMWAVIQGVWVEMLCFSAGRCRGYLHAKSLGNGGEYLSYVWLLLSYMGMETMPERMQRTEPHTVGDTGSLVKTHTDADTDDEDDGGPAQGRTAAPRRRRASHVAPSATPQPQASTAFDAQTAPQQPQRPVATPLPAKSATSVVPVVGDDNV